MSNRTEKIAVFVEPELKREAERVAEAEGRSLSNLVRRALVRLTAEYADSPGLETQRITDATRKMLNRRN
jgi:hypothetical protein